MLLAGAALNIVKAELTDLRHLFEELVCMRITGMLVKVYIPSLHAQRFLFSRHRVGPRIFIF